MFICGWWIFTDCFEVIGKKHELAGHPKLLVTLDWVINLVINQTLEQLDLISQ